MTAREANIEILFKYDTSNKIKYLKILVFLTIT